jgi:methylmalonyl-CoA mutase N-terminal domain/subunit
MNQFTDDSPVGIDVMRIDPLVEQEQATRVAQVRASRDDAKWQQTLHAVSRAAQNDTNLVPPIIAAVEARATVGEISDTLRAIFGEHREEGI